MYEVVIRNLTFEEAKMIYALEIGVPFNEIWGTEGMTWSGLGKRSRDPSREAQTITIQPMEGE